MSKQKKKRNKKYSGSDAASSRPNITKVTAANRSSVGQWLYDRKMFLRPVGVVIGVIILVIVVVLGIASLF